MHSHILFTTVLAGTQIATAAIRDAKFHDAEKTKTVWVTSEEIVRARPTGAAAWAGILEHGIWGGHLDPESHKAAQVSDHKKAHEKSHDTHKRPKTTKKPKTLSQKAKHPKTTHSTIENVESDKSHSHSKSSSAPSPTDYIQTIVYHHNLHRKNHSAPDIAWDASLASSASTIAAKCVFKHNVHIDGGGYGQNIAAGTAPEDISKVITDEFYNAEVNWFSGLYGQANPTTNFEHWGHFSQLVWKTSTHVGCATHYCSNGLADTGAHVDPYFTVCNYKNPGNRANYFAQNVGKPLGYPTVYGS